MHCLKFGVRTYLPNGTVSLHRVHENAPWGQGNLGGALLFLDKSKYRGQKICNNNNKFETMRDRKSVQKNGIPCNFNFFRHRKSEKIKK